MPRCLDLQEGRALSANHGKQGIRRLIKSLDVFLSPREFRRFALFPHRHRLRWRLSQRFAKHCSSDRIEFDSPHHLGSGKQVLVR